MSCPPQTQCEASPSGRQRKPQSLLQRGLNQFSQSIELSDAGLGMFGGDKWGHSSEMKSSLNKASGAMLAVKLAKKSGDRARQQTEALNRIKSDTDMQARSD